MTRKEYRAEMRRKHGPDWWKAKAKKVIPYEKKWAGFPILVGGMEDSSLLHPEDGDSIYKGDLVYQDMDQVGETGWGVRVWQQKGSKYMITGFGSEPYAGGDSQENLLSWASKAEAIRYLKRLKDYYGPSEEP
jgi:hypothetical protein